MVDAIKAIIKMIRKMETALSSGLMADSLKANGKMVNNTVSVHIKQPLAN